MNVLLLHLCSNLFTPWTCPNILNGSARPKSQSTDKNITELFYVPFKLNINAAMRKPVFS